MIRLLVAYCEENCAPMMLPVQSLCASDFLLAKGAEFRKNDKCIQPDGHESIGDSPHVLDVIVVDSATRVFALPYKHLRFSSLITNEQDHKIGFTHRKVVAV